MTSSFSARITVDAGENTKAIFDSVRADNAFYPENPTKTAVSFDGLLHIGIESGQIPHLRANLNSTLRLVQGCHDAIESVKI